MKCDLKKIIVIIYKTVRQTFCSMKKSSIFVLNSEKKMEQQQISAYLLKNGIRPLQKRVKIMSYLVSKRNHPT